MKQLNAGLHNCGHSYLELPVMIRVLIRFVRVDYVQESGNQARDRKGAKRIERVLKTQALREELVLIKGIN